MKVEEVKVEEVNVEEVKDSEEEVKRCERCEGCGQITSDDGGTPWIHWSNLPLSSAGAVLLGVVKPLVCPECNGSGRALQ